MTCITSTTTRTRRLQRLLAHARRTLTKGYTRSCRCCLTSCSCANRGKQRVNNKRGFKLRWRKKCFERKAARAQFFLACYFTGRQPPIDFSVHLAEYKGSWREEEDCEDSDNDDSTSDQQYLKHQFFKKQCLADQASVYQGILPDTGAANVSTDPTVKMDTSTAGKASINTAQVSTDIRTINFEVLNAPTPFLLCLADMDRLKVYFNNTTDELVQSNIHIPRERATVFLTETELRRLYRRFGHLAVMRLAKLLKDAGHDNFEERTLKEDDHHFNYEILVDVMYLSSKLVLHVETWQALRMLWIDTYQGPPDIITHDAGTNFASAEFRAEAKIIGVTCKQVPTEAHWSVGKTERYYAPLRQAWDILHAELSDAMSDEAILQIAVKAVNDTARPDRLVPTLLVFGAYPRMTTESPPSPSMVKPLRKLSAERQVADALNTLLIVSIDSHNVTVDMVNGPATFRSTVSDPDAPHAQNESHEPVTVPPAAQPRKRGHPPGLKNKRKAHAYITKKEQDDLELAIKLRNDRVITTSGAPFEALHSRVRIFKSRLVREVKGKTTKLYKKSRLEAILTQSPTIQRCSQRLIMSLAPVLAYPQARTTLKRTILAYLPTELPLYGIAEAGVHWWTTYHGHHCRELDMSTSTDDPDVFGIVGMQTDDTLMLSTLALKLKSILTPKVELDFNGCTLTIDSSKPAFALRQKGQGGKIKLVNASAPDRAQQYTEQRACGAYIASTCQPEASFDLSVAAQAQQPSDEDIKALNKRLKWQMENLDRGLRYVTVNLMEAKLIVFVDGSFANNKDLSLQLGFILMLVNESTDVSNTFKICGNVIHYSSTKCKRVTRSVLASEIYGMVNGFDIGIAIATTLRIVTERLRLPAIPLVICTDSYSLYECLVKLGTTKEKRLMIDIMALRQSYKRREITEIRWINGDDNPADAFTKASPNHALESFINSNELTV
ncbi:hypothetical protein EK21DRAFT_103538 [Setomelanomma holmii]|uniref:Integrase catalytic domain-containing protein n=1 Tax=Setomelanomma holmii TaxID=210430 RepID=A0A9P4H0C9_9PLEO|nr:hypothetical protein EK21DRAFT_103538 [Setomelanomma holmii]